eukprot:gene19014-38186_t
MALQYSENNLIFNHIPPELTGKINLYEWNAICSAYREAKNDADFRACAGEIVICFCTGFFCIFCCHPMIAAVISESCRHSKCNNINRRLFNGAQVVTTYNSRLCINSSLLPDGRVSHPQTPNPPF